MAFLTERKCIVCQRTFNIKEGRMGKAKDVRTKNCLTCSKQCSVTYNRIRSSVTANYIAKQKRLKSKETKN